MRENPILLYGASHKTCFDIILLSASLHRGNVFGALSIVHVRYMIGALFDVRKL